MVGLARVQTAIVGKDDGTLTISSQAGVPGITGDWVLVKTKAISINPVDAKMIGAKSYVTPGAISGCDFAGDVIEVGPESDLKIGDRVCGALMGMNPLMPSVGAFATYAGASSTYTLRIPDHMSYAEASAVGTSFLTGVLALFYSLALPGSPGQPLQTTQPVHVLVSGGASGSGTAAMQLLRLAGLVPIATASPHHFALCKAYGAEAVFDYKSANCAADIKKYTNNELVYALDCITTFDSMKLCYASLGRAGGRYTALDPYPEEVAATRKRVKADWVLGPTMMGQEIAWPEPHYRAIDPDIRAFGLNFRALVEKFLEDGKLKVHPIDVRTGGLEGALRGLDDVKKGLVRGQKLVYDME